MIIAVSEDDRATRWSDQNPEVLLWRVFPLTSNAYLDFMWAGNKLIILKHLYLGVLFGVVLMLSLSNNAFYVFLIVFLWLQQLEKITDFSHGNHRKSCLKMAAPKPPTILCLVSRIASSIAVSFSFPLLVWCHSERHLKLPAYPEKEKGDVKEENLLFVTFWEAWRLGFCGSRHYPASTDLGELLRLAGRRADPGDTEAPLASVWGGQCLRKELKSPFGLCELHLFSYP